MDFKVQLLVGLWIFVESQYYCKNKEHHHASLKTYKRAVPKGPLSDIQKLLTILFYLKNFFLVKMQKGT